MVSMLRKTIFEKGQIVSLALVVFDWDGTLMDSTGAIAHSIQSAARDLGLAQVPTAARDGRGDVAVAARLHGLA
ncbi:MAG: hypothetical protein EBW11_07480, partial [Betaproteobacteria bacterium]|nr:hypothetical protein [Betaproteobacteria bacterium]